MILTVSFFSRKKLVDEEGYLLGGRSIPPWMSAFSYGTAYFSSVIFIGYAGKLGWGFGLSVLWIALGNTVVGTLLAWKILGKKTREMTQRLKASTMPEFLGIRYESLGIKVFSALIIFIFLLPYAAGVYKGLGFLFENIFGIPMDIVYLIMVCVTAFYLFVGGFMATSIADFIQGCIMIVGAVLLVFYVMTSEAVGGLLGVYRRLEAIPQVGKQLVSPVGPPGLALIVSLVILTSLGSWGLPQMVHKFYTIKNERSIKTAAVVSTGFAALITTSAYLTGAVSRLVLSNVKPESYDQVIPMVMEKTLPLAVSAVLLVLVLSASMSTLASVVIAASSAVAVDLVKTIKPGIQPKQNMLILRCMFVVFVVGSFLLAKSESSIMNLAALSWGTVSGCLLAPYILGLYWKKANLIGAYAGMITALIITITGVLLLEGGVSSPYIPIVGALSVVLPFIPMSIVSLVTRPHEKGYLNYIYATK